MMEPKRKKTAAEKWIPKRCLRWCKKLLAQLERVLTGNRDRKGGLKGAEGAG
jgi:hypothetical protein